MLYFISLLCVIMSVAPPPPKMGIHASQLVYMPLELEGGQVLDTARMSVLYRAVYPVPHIKDGVAPAEDMALLQVGKGIDKFFSGNLHAMDRRRSGLEVQQRVRPRQDYIPYEVFTDRRRGVLRVVNRMPFMSGSVRIYEEALPSIDWELADERDSVAGYACQVAYATVFGRRWRVCYAPEIAASAGPWKLRGLPGIILRAIEDRGQFSFEAVEVTAKSVYPYIVTYGWLQEQVSKSEWCSFERNLHDSPAVYASQGTGQLFFDVTTGKDLGPGWKIPYTPIEIEP